MRRIGKFYSKTEWNCEDTIWYHRFQVYEVNNLNYSNIPSIAKFSWAEMYVDEFNQIVKVYGTPGVARVIITLSRIML